MIIPNIPKNDARNIKGYFISLRLVCVLNPGIANEDIPVMATTIIIAWETIPASTAPCPITRPPTILIAEPICLGVRMLASLKISKVNSISSASMIAGKGTSALEVEIVIKRGVGIISWWKPVKAIYMEEPSIVIARMK